jgi:hypothetical protein
MSAVGSQYELQSAGLKVPLRSALAGALASFFGERGLQGQHLVSVVYCCSSGRG